MFLYIYINICFNIKYSKLFTNTVFMDMYDSQKESNYVPKKHLQVNLYNGDAICSV